MPNSTIIADAIYHAREVQDFLWGDIVNRPEATMSHLLEVLNKRIQKLKAIDLAHPSADVELRKRLLQTASVAIAWLERLELGGIESFLDKHIPVTKHQYYIEGKAQFVFDYRDDRAKIEGEPIWCDGGFSDCSKCKELKDGAGAG